MDFTLVSAQRLDWGKWALDTLRLAPQVLRNSCFSLTMYTRAPLVANSSQELDELPTDSFLLMATTGHPEYWSTRRRYCFPA